MTLSLLSVWSSIFFRIKQRTFVMSLVVVLLLLRKMGRMGRMVLIEIIFLVVNMKKG